MKYFIGISLAMSFLLNAVLLVVTLDLDMRMAMLTMGSVNQAHINDEFKFRLNTYEGRVMSLHRDMALLITHCEVAMDLGVSTSRGGWWNKRAAEQLRMLQQIKTLREENNYHEGREADGR